MNVIFLFTVLGVLGVFFSGDARGACTAKHEDTSNSVNLFSEHADFMGVSYAQNEYFSFLMDRSGDEDMLHIYQELSYGDFSLLTSFSAGVDETFNLGKIYLDGRTVAIGVTLASVTVIRIYQASTPSSTDWIYVTDLLNSDSTNTHLDEFGPIGVVFNTDIDGKNIVVGAPGMTAHSIYQAGAAYVFHESSPGVWNEVAKLTAEGDANANGDFGTATGISGQYIVVSAPNDDNAAFGQAFVFKEATLDQGDWTRLVKLDQWESPALQGFGSPTSRCVAMDAHKIVLTSDKAPHPAGGNTGGAFVFKNDGTDQFPMVDSLYPDENLHLMSFGAVSPVMTDEYIVLGSLYYSTFDGTSLAGSVGMMYIFTELMPDAWTFLTKIPPPEPADGWGMHYFVYLNRIVCSGQIFADTYADTVFTYYLECDCASENDTCLHSGLCTDAGGILGNVQTCNCNNTGYEGDICQTDVDDCASSPCLNGAMCMDVGTHNYTCDCTNTGHTGTTCEIPCPNCCLNGSPGPMNGDLDVCDCMDTGHIGTTCEIPCLNGSPGPMNGSLDTCDCMDTGHIGATCEIPCLNGSPGPMNGSLDTCECMSTRHIGTTCEIPCLNGSPGPMNGDLDVCDCMSTGHIGATCEIPCLNGSPGPTNGSLDVCECMNTRHIGTTCEIPCMNGSPGPMNGSFDTCDCMDTGHIGATCEVNIDECLSSPCLSGSTCVETSAHPFFLCNCSGTGHEGSLCETDIDECNSSPCLNNGTCDDGIMYYRCNCDGTSYIGANCEIKCLHNGVNVDDKCDCSDTGYNGTTCQNNIDECKSAPCMNEGTCTDEVKTYTCDCGESGYTGLHCEIPPTPANPCGSSPCFHDGICEPSNTTTDENFFEYECHCENPYVGPLCETLDACMSAPCVDGSCTREANDSFTCVCDDGYEGVFCQISIDTNACKSAPCLNDGTCTTHDTKEFQCECTSTYSGKYCHILLDDDSSVVPVTIMITALSFAASSGETPESAAESFAEELKQTLLPDALGGTPSDYEVNVVETSNNHEELYNFIIESNNPSGHTVSEIEEIITNDPDMSERVGGDLRVSVREDPASHDDKDTAKNDSGMLIIIISIVVVVVIGAGVGGFLFYKKQQSAKTFTMPT